jgi:hypothetical protein
VVGPGPVRLVGCCPRGRRLVALAVAASTGHLFRALVALLGDAGLADRFRQARPMVAARDTVYPW